MRYNVVSFLALGLAGLAAAADKGPTPGFNPISVPAAGDRVSKGHWHDVEWAPSKKYKGNVNVVLYSGSSSATLTKVRNLASNIQNSGHIRWKPRQAGDVKKAWGIKVESSVNPDLYQWSGGFRLVDGGKKDKRTSEVVYDSATNINGEETHEHSESSGGDDEKDHEQEYETGGDDSEQSYEPAPQEHPSDYGAPPPCPSTSSEPCHECEPPTQPIHFTPPPPPTGYAQPTTPPPYPTATQSSYAPPASTGYVPPQSSYAPGPTGGEPAASATPTGAANRATYNLGAAGVVGGAIAALVL